MSLPPHQFDKCHSLTIVICIAFIRDALCVWLSADSSYALTSKKKVLATTQTFTQQYAMNIQCDNATHSISIISWFIATYSQTLLTSTEWERERKRWNKLKCMHVFLILFKTKKEYNEPPNDTHNNYMFKERYERLMKCKQKQNFINSQKKYHKFWRKQLNSFGANQWKVIASTIW